MILLMDGVKYEEWTPPSHDELEEMVKEHHREIFGEGSLYFDVKHKLRGGSLGAIPDAYCLTFAPDTMWVIEVERSAPGCYDHIVAQLSRFMNGLAEPQAQRELRDALLGSLDQQAKDRLRGRAGELHPWLEQRISAPSLLIATEKATDEIRRASRGPHFQAKVLEFATFRRQGAEAVHIHQFEPLQTRVLPSPPPEPPPIGPTGGRGGEALPQILEVVALMDQGRGYPAAVRTVAERRHVHYSTVSDKRTRTLHLTPEQFIALVKDRDGLRAFLIGKFPSDRERIEAALARQL